MGSTVITLNQKRNNMATNDIDSIVTLLCVKLITVHSTITSKLTAEELHTLVSDTVETLNIDMILLKGYKQGLKEAGEVCFGIGINYKDKEPKIAIALTVAKEALDKMRSETTEL